VLVSENDDNDDDGDDEADGELSDVDNVPGTEAGNDNDDADSLHLHLDTEDVEDTQCMSASLPFQYIISGHHHHFIAKEQKDHTT